MKRLFTTVLIIALCIGLFGCRSVQPIDTAPNNISSPSTPPTTEVETENRNPEEIPQKPLYSISLPVITQSESANDGNEIFRYVYQNVTLIGPEQEVVDKIILDLLNRIDQTTATADSVLSAAMDAYTPGNWNPYLCQITYKPMRIDQSVLSLYCEYITYSGTSHPEYITSSVTYDLVNGAVLKLTDILSAETSSDALCELVINALQIESASEHLYEGFEDTVKDRFHKPLEYDTAWDFDKNGLRIYFSAYEIAPYSSGVVVAQIPYSDLVGIIKDDYFPAESDASSGCVFVQSFDEASIDNFTQISEVVLKTNGDKVLLYTDRSVSNVAVYSRSWNADGTSYVNTYQVFAANSLTPGDAIMIEADFGDSQRTLLISYSSNGKQFDKVININRETNELSLTDF